MNSPRPVHPNQRKGRPRVRDGERTEQIGVEVSHTMKATLRKMATDNGMSLSAMGRWCIAYALKHGRGEH